MNNDDLLFQDLKTLASLTKSNERLYVREETLRVGENFPLWRRWYGEGRYETLAFLKRLLDRTRWEVEAKASSSSNNRLSILIPGVIRALGLLRNQIYKDDVIVAGKLCVLSQEFEDLRRRIQRGPSATGSLFASLPKRSGDEQ